MTDVDLTIRVKNNLPSVAREVEGWSDLLIDNALSELVSNVRKSMSLPKTGRPYPPPGFRASAPGQAPAIRPLGVYPVGYPTGGELFASISKERTGSTSGRVYTRVDYARYLEYGTRHMRPRPFMRPAARALRGKWKAVTEGKLAVVIARKART